MQTERNNTDLTQLIKATDVAYLFNISLSNVYKLVRDKKLPYKRIGSSIRFKYDEVLDAIETHSIEMRSYVTRKELAAQLGVHYQTVTAWTESGIFDGYMHRIGGIARYNMTAILLAFEAGKFENNISSRILLNIKQKIGGDNNEYSNNTEGISGA